MSGAITITPASSTPLALIPTAGLPITIEPVESEAIEIVGVIGIPGPRGEPGLTTAPQAVQHTQSVAAATWTIAHNLARFPLVTLYTVGGTLMIGEVVNLNNNVCQVKLDQPMTGKAILI